MTRVVRAKAGRIGRLVEDVRERCGQVRIPASSKTRDEVERKWLTSSSLHGAKLSCGERVGLNVGYGVKRSRISTLLCANCSKAQTSRDRR